LDGEQRLVTLTVLIDDVRRFQDGRPCQVARSSRQGVDLLTELQASRIDDLWLDHDLGGEDTIWPVIEMLEQAALAGCPWEIGVLHVHAARPGPAHHMMISLRRTGYQPVRSYDRRLWTWKQVHS
jgi:hypothetical protein